MLLPKSICVHVLYSLSLSHQGVVWSKYHFCFFGPDMDTEMGVVIYMYLKHSPEYIESKYIWVHGLTT